MKEPQVFTTINTGLAAFLAVSKVKLLKLDISVNPAVYTFESNGSLQDLLMQWKAEITPHRLYYNTYRSFIDQIKERNG